MGIPVGAHIKERENNFQNVSSISILTLKKKIKAKYKDDQMETLVFFSEDSIYPSINGYITT